MFNKPSEKINLNSPDPNSDIYISEGERFNKDFAAYDYNRRNIEHERKKEMYQNRKNQLYERERKRWEKMDYEYLRAENKIMMNKERNLVGRKNNPGMAFNPLTLQYDNSVQGEILKRRDDESKFRALMRATNIDKHANAGYNIINGEERTIMENRMLKEIEPTVYKKNIDKINEINQRHNDNDNFYTKGPSYNQPKNQFQPIQEPNEYKEQGNDDYKKREEVKNIPPSNGPNDFKRPPSNEYNNQRMTPKNEINNIPPNDIPRNEDYNRMTPNQNIENMPQNNNYQRMTPQNNNYNNIPPNENYRRQTPQNKDNYNNMPQNDNYQKMTPQNYNNMPVNENYRKQTPQNNNYDNMPVNENYRRQTPQNNNYDNIPPNGNYARQTPQNNNYDNIQNNREYRRTPYSENNYNNYRRMTPSNHGYNNRAPQNEEFQKMIPDHYSEQDRLDRINQNMKHDFDRQYNYIGNQDQNYEDYKNQEYYNEKQGPNEYYAQPQKNENFYGKRDPYARPDYYATNRPRTMG